MFEGSECLQFDLPRTNTETIVIFLHFIALLLRSSHSQTVLAQSIDSAGQCSGTRSQILRRAELEMPPHFFCPAKTCAVGVSVSLSVGHSGPERHVLGSQIVIKFRKGPLSEILNPLTFHPGSLLVLRLTQHLQQAIIFICTDAYITT